MGSRPILPVKLPITINTMVNFDGGCDGDGDGVGICKQTLRPSIGLNGSQAHSSRQPLTECKMLNGPNFGVGTYELGLTPIVFPSFS